MAKKKTSRVNYGILYKKKTGITPTPPNWEAPYFVRGKYDAAFAKNKAEAKKLLKIANMDPKTAMGLDPSGMPLQNPLSLVDLAIWGLWGYKMFAPGESAPVPKPNPCGSSRKKKKKKNPVGPYQVFIKRPSGPHKGKTTKLPRMDKATAMQHVAFWESRGCKTKVKKGIKTIQDWTKDASLVGWPNPSATSDIICYGQVNAGNWSQEWYESSSRHAGKRARALRKLGYKVTTSPMGPQVTPVGVVKMTLVDIRPGKNRDTTNLPAVYVERMR